MLDAVPIPQMQRTRGRAEVALVAAPGGARLVRLGQRGSAKAFLPRVHSPVPEVVFLNTAGGLTGGDRMSFALELGARARAVATTQTAERAYAASGGVAELDVEISVGAGGALDWLPQETIVFDRSALTRRTEIALAGDARCLFVETLVLGRAAMGETVEVLALRDTRRVTRDGVPVLIEPLRLGAQSLARRQAGAGLAGARAVATLALAAPGAEDALGPLRAALAGAEGVRAAASGWDGKCVLRLMADDAYPLRRALIRALNALRGGAPLPRVWQM
ncbi:MAG: urease accessory protein UreD [Rhodobacteraceae bacterium]|nr:urease accessory protein UreD [Paracoccaceae bacterium]